MTPSEYEAAIPEKLTARIAEIDKMFEEATGWGSWMATASSERRGLVRRLEQMGVFVPHKWELRTAGGQLSD